MATFSTYLRLSTGLHQRLGGLKRGTRCSIDNPESEDLGMAGQS